MSFLFRYSVADTPFSVPSNVTTDELCDLINGLLKADGSDGDGRVAFDFLIGGTFLHSRLEEHMRQNDISTETVVEIEYVERSPTPEPEDSLLHDDWVSAVRAQGTCILTGCYDNTLKLWSTSGELLLTMPGHLGPVKCVTWVDSGDALPVRTFLSGSHDETVLLWQWNQDTNAVECVHACRGHAGSVDCLAVNPEHTRFCSGSWDTMLKIWSAVINSDEDGQLEEHSEKPAKRKKMDGGTKIPTRVPTMTLSGHKEGISSAQWVGTNEVYTASWDHTIKMWDIEQATEKSCIAGTKVFFDIAYSPLNRMLVAASADRHVRLYDPRTSDGAVVKCTFTSHTGWVSAVAWSPVDEHQFISGSYDSVLKQWDTRSPKAPLFDLTGHDDRILAVDWSIPQMVLSGGTDNHLKVFRVSNPAPKTKAAGRRR
ncbi:hypothetical protein NP493_424g02080 [Ridgeia piscesae]|uniref:Ribosome biogenesis protein WDR12 homolog n=1 Tax=Ridgeia piscesae TaxID=27915 RepID=A0AAD9L0M5_RIDPI|nr:hypothetical protein NP493_424g02080 [Ridgeia piscesae]